MRSPALFALVATMLLSCGGDDTTADAVLVDDFCSGWVSSLCSAGSRCGCMVDTATCEMRAAASCVLDRGRPTRMMVDDGTLAYDAAAAGRYLDSVAARPCNERPTLCETSEACLGLSAEGGACGTTIGCLVGLACIDGTCRSPSPDGSTCTTSSGCTSGRCERGECLPKADLGAACSEESACESGNCDFATGRCRAKEALDALCTEHSECESGYCDRDLVLGAGNCQPLQAIGNMCDEDSMCADGACLGGFCGPGLCDDIIE